MLCKIMKISSSYANNLFLLILFLIFVLSFLRVFADSWMVSSEKIIISYKFSSLVRKAANRDNIFNNNTVLWVEKFSLERSSDIELSEAGIKSTSAVQTAVSTPQSSINEHLKITNWINESSVVYPAFVEPYGACFTPLQITEDYYDFDRKFMNDRHDGLTDNLPSFKRYTQTLISKHVYEKGTASVRVQLDDRFYLIIKTSEFNPQVLHFAPFGIFDDKVEFDNENVRIFPEYITKPLHLNSTVSIVKAVAFRDNTSNNVKHTNLFEIVRILLFTNNGNMIIFNVQISYVDSFKGKASCKLIDTIPFSGAVSFGEVYDVLIVSSELNSAGSNDFLHNVVVVSQYDKGNFMISVTKLKLNLLPPNHNSNNNFSEIQVTTQPNGRFNYQVHDTGSFTVNPRHFSCASIFKNTNTEGSYYLFFAGLGVDYGAFTTEIVLKESAKQLLETPVWAYTGRSGKRISQDLSFVVDQKSQHVVMYDSIQQEFYIGK